MRQLPPLTTKSWELKKKQTFARPRCFKDKEQSVINGRAHLQP